jgi:hypothetical protein
MPNLIQHLRRDLAPYFLSYDGTRDLGRGTAFPASADLPGGLQTYDRFFRTDLLFQCVYDGTRWLTLHEYVQPIVYQSDLTVDTDTALTTVALSAALGIYVTRVSVITRVSTTNNGTNFWTITVQGINTAVSASDTIYSFNTSADAVNVYVAREGATLNVLTDDSWLRINAARTLTPGTLRIAVTAYYRLIVT